MRLRETEWTKKNDLSLLSPAEINKEQEGECVRHDPFPTLEEVLTEVGDGLGFNIEIKYPQQLIVSPRVYTFTELPNLLDLFHGNLSANSIRIPILSAYVFLHVENKHSPSCFIQKTFALHYMFLSSSIWCPYCRLTSIFHAFYPG